MTYRATTFLSIIASVVLFTITSCDVLDTGEGKKHFLQLHVNASEPVVESTDGNATIEVTNIKFLLDSFHLRTVNVDVVDDSVVVEVDSVMFQEKFPRVISFTPGDQGELIELSQINTKTYRQAGFSINPPGGNVSDPDLGSEYSFMIQGTYNGNSFTYRSSHDSMVVKRISPELEMTDQTKVLNVDLIVNTEALFRKPEGGLLDPTKSAAKTKLEDRVIKVFQVAEGTRSLRKYEDMRTNE